MVISLFRPAIRQEGGCARRAANSFLTRLVSAAHYWHLRVFVESHLRRTSAKWQERNVLSLTLAYALSLNEDHVRWT